MSVVNGSDQQRLKVLKLREDETAFASGQLYGALALGNGAVFTDSTRRVVAVPLREEVAFNGSMPPEGGLELRGEPSVWLRHHSFLASRKGSHG